MPEELGDSNMGRCTHALANVDLAVETLFSITPVPRACNPSALEGYPILLVSGSCGSHRHVARCSRQINDTNRESSMRTRTGEGAKANLGFKDTLNRLQPVPARESQPPEPGWAKLEISAGHEHLNEQGETVVAAIGGATHARGRGVKAVLGVFGRLGSITTGAGPIITTSEPFFGKIGNQRGQEHVNEQEQRHKRTLTSAIRGQQGTATFARLSSGGGYTPCRPTKEWTCKKCI